MEITTSIFMDSYDPNSHTMVSLTVTRGVGTGLNVHDGA
jgi:hypothetical protein